MELIMENGKLTIVRSLRRAFIISSVLLIFNFPFLIFNSRSHAQLVNAVSAVGMTVADLDRSVDFFTRVLGFKRISDIEVYGDEYEKLQGVFGLRMRVARLKLGDETIELTQYLAPEGRPIPSDWRSNDHSFQHIAIVVSDMDKAYQHLRSHKVRHASTGPQTIPADNKAAAGIGAFISKIPTGIFWKSFIFFLARAIRAGNKRLIDCFSASITPPSSSRTRRAV